MKVLVVTNVFHPDHAGGAAVFTDLCLDLVARGHEVEVRCAFSYFPEWKDKSGRNGLRRDTESFEGIRVVRFGLFIPRNPQSAFQRALYELSFLLSLLRSVGRGRFDVVIAFSTMLSPIVFAEAMSTLHRIPSVVSVQDVSSAGAAATGLVGRRVARTLERLEIRVWRRAARLTTISPTMLANVERQTGRADVQYLPNWLNERIAQRIESFPTKVGRPPQTVPKLLYAGNIGGKQGLVRFCEALRQVEGDFEFAIHGAGGHVADVHEWYATHTDARFTVGPLLSEERFADALHQADMFVITELPGSGGAYMPSKLIPAIATGTPILAVCDFESPLGMEVEKHDLGLRLDWEAIPDGIRAMLSSIESQMTQWQQSALERSRAFDRQRVLEAWHSTVCEAAARP